MRKIILSSELREKILLFRKDVETRVAQREERLQELRKREAELYATLMTTRDELSALSSETSAEAFDAVASLQARVTAVEGRLSAVATELAEAEADRLLAYPCPLLNEIRQFWIERLPRVVADELRPFYRDDASALRAAEQTDAFQFANYIKATTDRMFLSDYSVPVDSLDRFVNGVLDRALNGSLTLTFDPSKAEDR